MTTLLLSLAPLLPVLLAPFSVTRRAPLWLPLAAAPIVAAALLVPVGTSVGIPWLMLGTRLELDGTGRLFLLYSGAVWLAAAAYLVAAPARRPLRPGFGAWFLLAMAGNVLLILASDMLTFYLGFTLMGLSAYGLLLGRHGQRARNAGRIYLVFTLIGEVALFAALVLLAAHTDSVRFADLVQQPLPDAALLLLLIGFGIKVALPGLHAWMLPAYTAGPVVAVAVLSGPMMKAGLLGWLRFVPPQAVDGTAWGTVLIALGVVGVLLGVGLGVLQRRPRAVLAYSSIAKMGLISALFGAALLDPVQAPALIAALTLFAVHHLLVKSALFLGVGLWERGGPGYWVLIGAVLLALTLVGLPFTGGAAAKAALADALRSSGLGLSTLLTVAAVGTVLLMARFIYLLSLRTSDRGASSGLAPFIWLGLVVLAFWAPFPPAGMSFAPTAFWPIAGGLVLAWLATRLRRPGERHAGRARLRRFLVRRMRSLFPVMAALHWPIVPGRSVSAWRPTANTPVEPGLDRAGLRWLAVLAALLVATLLPA